MTDRHAWTEEGAHAVAPGVHRIPLPLPSDGLRAVNAYAIEADSGLVLIDSGWALANARDQLERSLAAIGAGLRDVRQFLVTHMHRDHYTQAVEIRRLFGTPVALGEGERPSIDGLLSGEFQPFRAQLAILRGAGASQVADRLAAMMSIELPGREREPVEVVSMAPGHPRLRPGATIGAALGYEQPDQWIAAAAGLRPRHARPDRDRHCRVTPAATWYSPMPTAGLLFAGDHVLPHITPSIGFQEAPSAEPLREYLRSLTVVRRLPDMRLLPAHGPVSPSTHSRIDELIDHHAERLRVMADVVADGPCTGYDVALAIGWTRRQRKLADLDPMNQMLAICETVYHLDLLVAQEAAVSQSGDDGVRRYRLAGQTRNEQATA